MGDSNYENFYNGGISSFEPNYSAGGSFIGYHVGASTLASTTSPQTANQVKEVISRLKEGVKNVELQPLGEGVMDTIPKQHFAEMRALMKLSGVKPSMHAPIVDAAGFGQQGYSESNKIESERRLFSTLERAKELGPEENVPVVMHSSAGIPGNEYIPEDEKKGTGFHLKKIVLVDRETGQLAAEAKEDRKFYPEKSDDFDKGGTLHEPLKQVRSINATKWDQTLTSLAQFTKMADEVIGDSPVHLKEYFDKKMTEDVFQSMPDEAKFAYGKLNEANIFLQNAHLNFNNAFNTAYKYGNEPQRNALKEIAKKYSEEVNKAQGSVAEVIAHKSALGEAVKALSVITSPSADPNTGKLLVDPNTGKPIFDAPQELIPVEEFAREKAAETFGNVAWRSYKELGGEKAPVMAIENMYQGMAFARAEDMAKLIDESRNKFIEKAKKDGMSDDEARKAAEKLIGATWDVGHLNLFKKSGFRDEQLIEETKKISKYVKHVHLTDNFGYGDSHLAPGMGNVPIKEILKELEKSGDFKSMRKVIEAGGLVNPNMGLGISPLKATLSAFGAPIYGGSGTYWNQTGGIAVGGGYFGGQGYLPEKHFSMYGTGFSSLPTELGGNIPGTQSRFSGTPNA